MRGGCDDVVDKEWLSLAFNYFTIAAFGSTLRPRSQVTACQADRNTRVGGRKGCAAGFSSICVVIIARNLIMMGWYEMGWLKVIQLMR